MSKTPINIISSTILISGLNIEVLICNHNVSLLHHSGLAFIIITKTKISINITVNGSNFKVLTLRRSVLLQQHWLHMPVPVFIVHFSLTNFGVHLHQDEKLSRQLKIQFNLKLEHQGYSRIHAGLRIFLNL